MSITSILEKFKSLRVFVIGDIMLDKFISGTVQRISTEAPVPILLAAHERLSPGGSGNVAANLKSLGSSVGLFGVIGKDHDSETLLSLLKELQIEVEGIIRNPDKPTITKTRLIADNQQIARVDRENPSPWPDQITDTLLDLLKSSVNENPPQIIIISDYAKGLITDKFSTELIQLAKDNAILVAVDPKGRDFAKYSGTDVITPNRSEAEALCGFPINDENSLNKALREIAGITQADTVLITRGKDGISFMEQGGGVKTVSSEAREVFDVTGAGDTVLSAFVLSYLSSDSLEESVKIANIAAGLVVSRVGTSTVTVEELEDEIRRLDSKHNEKLLTKYQISDVAAAKRQQGKKIVFTNGCFDLFHYGHLTLLNESRRFGDILIVGINNDSSVKRLKGNPRPLVSQNDRVAVLCALECVDYIVLFGEDTPLELIKTLRPDVIVKGSDYHPDNVVGKDFVESYGGKVEIVPIVEGLSTSQLIDKIRENSS